MAGRESTDLYPRRGVVYRTLGGVAVAAVLLAVAVARRHALHDAAIRDWERRSSSSLQLASSSARAWIVERESAVRILGGSAERDPRIFEGAAAMHPAMSEAGLRSHLATALNALNQVSATPGSRFSELWIMNASGALVSSASSPRAPAIVLAAVRAAISSDSLLVVGPFPADGHRLAIAFVQPVNVRSAAQGGTAKGAEARHVGGAVVLATGMDAALLAELGAEPPGLASESTELLTQVRDSVHEYALAARAPLGYTVESWGAGKTPALQRRVLRSAQGAPTFDAAAPAVAVRLGVLPWGLVRRANADAILAAANAEFVREVATAIVALSALLWLVIAHDHRERARQLRGLAASEALYRLLADHSTDIIARHAPDGRVLYVSPAVQTVLGYAPDDLVGTYPHALRHEDDADTTHTALHRAFAMDEAVRAEHRLRHADGHFVWIETMGGALRDPATGAVTEFITTSRDIADAKAAEEALRISEEQYRLLFVANPMPMWTFDTETYRFLAVNDAAIAHYGYSRDEFLRMTVHDLRPPEFAHEVRPVLDRLVDGARCFTGLHHRTRDGRIIEVDVTVHALPLAGGATRLVLVTDVTEQRKVESALRESSEFVRAILDCSPVAVIATDPDLRVVQWNRAAEQLFGWRADEVVGRPNPIVPHSSPDFQAMLDTVRSAGRVANRTEHRLRKDGTLVEVSVSIAMIHTAAGAPAGFVALAVDLTERTRLEMQLRQAQKMEAVGQLAGGVAHDFNNLLTVITTYAELLISDLPENAPESAQVRADLTEIKGAGERAAVLTRQLLAFSRQQVLEPRFVGLNMVVRGVEQMLRRVLPPTIHVVTSLDPELGAVYADPGQIEQVLMNLIVNARDAMPEGGTLTIETANVEPESGLLHSEVEDDPYVMVTVSDTGCGIPCELLEHIFEPFFTTKDVGKGTGLGLSTAHGIVSQSGGHLAVRSAPGAGTTFTMYLPRSGAHAPDGATALQEYPLPVPQDAEVVLLVEDEAAVRVAATRILERAGYRVLVAADGPEALSLYAQRETAIDLVVTDMIMPTMSGAGLADALRANRPDLPVVFMSGFAEDTMITRGTDNGPITLLHKPFTPETLTRKVREALRSSHRALSPSPSTELV